MRTEPQTMTKTFTSIIILLFFISCKSGDNDIKLNSDNGDTLEVVKRYSSHKILEVTKYKDNRPSSNYCFSETGDTIKIPKLIHLVDKKSFHLFVPIAKNYTKVSVLFAFQDSTVNEPLYTADGFKNSTEFPISTIMVEENNVKGFIKCQSVKGDLTYFPFKIKL